MMSCFLRGRRCGLSEPQQAPRALADGERPPYLPEEAWCGSPFPIRSDYNRFAGNDALQDVL